VSNREDAKDAKIKDRHLASYAKSALDSSRAIAAPTNPALPSSAAGARRIERTFA
jgi:hypothetical protein